MPFFRFGVVDQTQMLSIPTRPQTTHTKQADIALRAVPVVVLSVDDRTADIAACMELGAKDYFIKPIRMDMAPSLLKFARDRSVVFVFVIVLVGLWTLVSRVESDVERGHAHAHTCRRREMAASFVDDRLPEGIDEDGADEDEEDEDGAKVNGKASPRGRAPPASLPRQGSGIKGLGPSSQLPPLPPPSAAPSKPLGGGGGGGGSGGGGASVDLMMWEGEPGMAGALEGASLEEDVLLPLGPTREHYSLVGTPYYMSPEMIDRVKYGPAVDYWALGVVAFECFAGGPPFTGDSPQAVFAAIRARRIPWRKLRVEEVSRELGPEMGAHLKSLIRGLLNPDQHARLGSGTDGAAAIMRHPFFAGVDWAALPTSDVGYSPAPRLFAVAQAEPGAVAGGAGGEEGQAGPAAAAAGDGAADAVAVGGQPLQPYRAGRRHHRPKRNGAGIDPPLSGSLDGFAMGPRRASNGVVPGAGARDGRGGGGGMVPAGEEDPDLEDDGVRTEAKRMALR